MFETKSDISQEGLLSQALSIPFPPSDAVDEVEHIIFGK
jgi:hypothetical protein